MPRTRPTGGHEEAPLDWNSSTYGQRLEWTADWYEDDYYSTSRCCTTRKVPRGTKRVLRGGSGAARAGCRIVRRIAFPPTGRLPATASRSLVGRGRHVSDRRQTKDRRCSDNRRRLPRISDACCRITTKIGHFLDRSRLTAKRVDGVRIVPPAVANPARTGTAALNRESRVAQHGRILLCARRRRRRSHGWQCVRKHDPSRLKILAGIGSVTDHMGQGLESMATVRDTG